ncbi:hypothetical protein KSS87_016707 [Heliosperma pusillum]|nr:hypothetical protein KSS87_016707 [Heliosperma pusillum]
MGFHIKSILIIFICVAIVGNHAAQMEVRTGNTEKKHNYVEVKPSLKPFDYLYKGNKSNIEKSMFFLEKNMKPGYKMTLNFTRSTNEATFVPKEKARSLPFSTDKIKEILHEFSMHSRSKEAQIIEETIKMCERKGISGEQKYCATCLEDMVDYVKSTLGKNVKAISSTKSKGTYSKGKTYTISKVKKIVKDDESVTVCHKLSYPYAVFYCHKTKGTSPYIVSLTSNQGIKAEIVVVCHKNTSGWNPKHMAFQVLGVKPGGLPICHFLPEDHIAWVRV